MLFVQVLTKAQELSHWGGRCQKNRDFSRSVPVNTPKTRPSVMPPTQIYPVKCYSDRKCVHGNKKVTIATVNCVQDVAGFQIFDWSIPHTLFCDITILMFLFVMHAYPYKAFFVFFLHKLIVNCDLILLQNTARE